MGPSMLDVRKERQKYKRERSTWVQEEPRHPWEGEDKPAEASGGWTWAGPVGLSLQSQGSLSRQWEGWRVPGGSLWQLWGSWAEEGGCDRDVGQSDVKKTHLEVHR